MSTVALRAKVKMPILPNFLVVEELAHGSLDEAIAKGEIKVDVGMLDDQALQDFCNEWTLAFVRHAKGRRKP